ncbi:phosphatidyl synthase [Cordyceps fumosorosea ARSEF 2679]|uniref:Phosphatidyl synthase n=1 Tax=Cordyceps fumosorosea (strain ARSEF 2679) TaxID=1081104 RepID=A0A167MJL2_CORFA|nr:phosphatidyl synthase [Cordyceps fumosorosea ARSEF 2679]OAA54433.1 phosphatidyl synthase [Cordyceps fumosorosea ARSEF 2679]
MLSLQAGAIGRTALRRTTLLVRPVSSSWPSGAAARMLSSSPLPRPLGRAKLGLVVPTLRRETSSKPPIPTRKPQPPTNAHDEAARIPTSSAPSSPSASPGAGGPLADPTLHEDIYTLPNILTMSRLVAAPVIGYFVLHDSHAWAAGLLAYAGVTDLLDGWIARRWNRKTVVGTVIDPMADKVLMTVLTVCLAVKGALPVWVASIILGRDVGLAIAAIYFRWISLPPPKTFTRYWDFSLPSAEVRPTTISKYNTFLQLALVGVTTAAPLVPLDLSQALSIMQYVVAATTIWSGASYVYTKDAVKILGAPKKQKNKQ